MDTSTGDWHERAMSLIALAVLAPSSHNTQPWLFRIASSVIDLYADRTRALPVNDPQDRELAISCGCAVMNLRVAAAAQGLRARVDLLPAADEPDWLARASFTVEPGMPGAEAALCGFVRHRRTYRQRFASREVDAATGERLVEAAAAEGAWLRPLVSEETRQQVAALVAQGDAAQWADPSWRRELAMWMHSRRQGDGLAVAGLAAPVARLVVRTFDMGGGVAAKDADLASASPLLAVLGTQHDEPRAWLVAGQALQRVLLTACELGLQGSYLNQPVQVPSLRARLASITRAGFPQIVLRLGYPGGEIAAAPRRALEAVVEHGARAQSGELRKR